MLLILSQQTVAQEVPVAEDFSVWKNGIKIGEAEKVSVEDKLQIRYKEQSEVPVKFDVTHVSNGLISWKRL
jgi:hypothetical protein